MKLSTRGRYGLRLMIDLALHRDEGPVFMKDIAARQGVSEKYLGNLMPPLKAMGLVHSIRGARGGYVLARNPNEITIKDIVSVLEGTLCLVDCVDSPDLCDRSSSCIARDIWSEVSRNILKVLDEVSLEAMVDRYREKDRSSATCA